MELGSVLQNLDLVTVGVGDEGHPFAVDEFFAPVAWPEVELQIQAFEHPAVGDDVIDANTGVNEIFGNVDFVVGRVGEFEIVCAAWDLEVCELVAAG